MVQSSWVCVIFFLQIINGIFLTSFTFSDQLWTNDGAYKAAPPGEEYPPDLDDYPEQKDGWMNEECVRIDLNHRLIPKPPLRSALKQTNLRG